MVSQDVRLSQDTIDVQEKRFKYLKTDLNFIPTFGEIPKNIYLKSENNLKAIYAKNT